MKNEVNLLPRLKDILNANYDPNGGYVVSDKDPSQLVMAPWSEKNVCTGTVSLNGYDYEAFQALCQKVKVKPSIPVIDLGGGGAMVGLSDLALAISKTTGETEVAVDMPASE